MSSSIQSLSRDEAWAQLPYSVRGQITLRDLPPVVTFVSFGVDNKDVVRRGEVAKVLSSIDANPLLAVGPNFTAEALDVFRHRGATVLSLGDFYWTEASLDAVR